MQESFFFFLFISDPAKYQITIYSFKFILYVARGNLIQLWASLVLVEILPSIIVEQHYCGTLRLSFISVTIMPFLYSRERNR